MILLDLVREVFRGAHEHTHCRCCETALLPPTAPKGGVGLWPVGRGFCYTCATAILAKDAKIGKGMK